MKVLSIILRILLILLLLMPIAGVSGLLPAPTAEMYTPQGWAFMSALMATGYLMYVMALVFAVCVVLLAIGQTALAAVLLAPITVNIMCFHWFLDAAPVSASSSLGYILLVLNLFFLWENRGVYKALWK
jgi:putative oxidoreductase